MERIHLTVTADYLDWNTQEVIREFLQNGLDAEKDGFPLTFEQPIATAITLTSKGARLEKKTMLIGYTTKKDRPDQIGKFGEGYKLGCIAALRLGMKVNIYNNEECWTPLIDMHPTLECKVLAFDIKPSSCKIDGVKVSIGNIPPDEALLVQDRCLTFQPNYKRYVGEEDGEILLDKRYVNKLFAGGIYIQELRTAVPNEDGSNEVEKPMDYGYNLAPDQLPIDRDRRMVDNYKLAHQLAYIWRGAVKASITDTGNVPKEMRLAFTKAIQNDLEEIGSYIIRGIVQNNDSLGQGLVADFHAKFGNKAYPTIFSSDVKAASMANLRPVALDQRNYTQALWEVMGDPDKLLATWEAKQRIPIADSELSHTTQQNLAALREYNPSAIPIFAAALSDQQAMGFYDKEECHVLIEETLIRDKPIEALSTMLHEVSHATVLGHGEDFIEAFHKTIEEFLKDKVVFAERKDAVAIEPDNDTLN